MEISKLKYLLLSGVVTLCLSGCGISVSADLGKPAPENVKVDLSLVRSALRLTEFEHYKLLGTKLFWECGERKRGRPFIKQQQVIDLPLQSRQKIAAQASLLWDKIGGGSVGSLGKSDTLVDPGEASIAITMEGEERRLLSTVDEIGSPSDGLNIEGQRLTRVIRGSIGDSPCGNRNFYGISKD